MPLVAPTLGSDVRIHVNIGLFAPSILFSARNLPIAHAIYRGPKARFGLVGVRSTDAAQRRGGGGGQTEARAARPSLDARLLRTPSVAF